jgi:hypothetical protein
MTTQNMLAPSERRAVKVTTTNVTYVPSMVREFILYPHGGGGEGCYFGFRLRKPTIVMMRAGQVPVQ